MRKIKAIWRQSLAEFMIYRGTSIITFLLATVFLLIELFAGQVYFSQRENLAGWTANLWTSVYAKNSLGVISTRSKRAKNFLSRISSTPFSQRDKAGLEVISFAASPSVIFL
jgi:ABC-type uncharacterized transport system permease subunit